METTDKAYCRELAELLYAHGVRDAVLCPGSRNAPLIVAIARDKRINSISVVDERSGAFIALGLALTKDTPVAIVCTSGSAVLNFAPAIAEAYYRRVPIIAISADRPPEWIDQDDSQTIRQNGILSNIVKESYTIPVEDGAEAQQWYANRIINDALMMAKSQPQGPVHINVHIDAPLSGISNCDIDNESRFVKTIATEKCLSEESVRHLAQRLSQTQKVLVIAGFMPPNPALDKALDNFAKNANVVIMHEAQANLKLSGKVISNIDSVLSCLTGSESRDLLPDIVITIGGSLVSRFVKDWLRKGGRSGLAQTDGKYRRRGISHWHIGMQSYSVDCFMALELRIETQAAIFFTQIADALEEPVSKSNYTERWGKALDRAKLFDKEFSKNLPWSDFKAISSVMPRIPHGWNLQLSNGTPIRYVQLFDYSNVKRIDCNRGVSGIDGCTSTAIGASIGYEGTTLLITGDMSMQYDIGALASLKYATRLKIIVLNNQGGGIFRFIGSTSGLKEREERLCCNGALPLEEMSKAYGYLYLQAESEREFIENWPCFVEQTDRNVILELKTPPQESANILNKYFSKGDIVAKRK